MMGFLGTLKVAAVLGLDFWVLRALLSSAPAAGAVTALEGLYAWLGGYLSLLSEGAVALKKLPFRERTRLSQAREQLSRSSGLDLAGLKLYLIPGSDELNATAYGANCVSVTRATLDSTDPFTLSAVLAHELSHIRCRDAEVSRAVFASVVLAVGCLSVAWLAVAAALFLLAVGLRCFRSWLGFLAFRGASKVGGGLVGLAQKGIVLVYRLVSGLVSRGAEYRSDRYCAQLGYAVQLAHFLSLAGEGERSLTLSQLLYRSHPPTHRRIARLEAQAGLRGGDRCGG